MKVSLISAENEVDIINKLWIACRTCYNEGTPEDLKVKIEEFVPKDKKLSLLKHVIESGHHSVLEHCQLTFTISGISRSCSHQLVRHRHASYSQQSQRYVKFKDGKFDYDIPTTIKNSELSGLYESTMIYLGSIYNQFVNAGIPAEDARAILPNACLTNITMSLNLRELIHICHERLCNCAQAEIHEMVSLMKKETVALLPFMKPYLVAKCEALGYCNEGKRSCGCMPLREDVGI